MTVYPSGLWSLSTSRLLAVFTALGGAPAMVWTNMPGADTDLMGSTDHYRRADTRGLRWVRFQVAIMAPGSAAGPANLRPQYRRPDLSWADLTASIDITSTTLLATAWTLLPGDAQKLELDLRVRGVGGNGVTDPAFAMIQLEGR